MKNLKNDSVVRDEELQAYLSEICRMTEDKSEKVKRNSGNESMDYIVEVLQRKRDSVSLDTKEP